MIGCRHLATIVLALVGGERVTNAQAPAGANGQVTCTPATSVACPPPTPGPLLPVGVPPTPEPEPEIPWYETLGWSFSVGGGVDDFARNVMRNATEIGGSWCARLL